MSKERLLKWYDYHELPNPMLLGGSTVIVPSYFGGQEVLIPGSITLKRIHSNDRIELKATIVWNFSLNSIASPEITVATQKMQFSIWRDKPFTGERLYTVLDAGSLTELIPVGGQPTIINNSFTTSFACTDQHVKGETHNYYLTASTGGTFGFNVFIGDGGGQPIPINNINAPTITEVHFSGFVIGENKT
ncbi:hypothetical protein ACFQZT_15025 [Paenibacillus sp. GCM10027628]|uniref:hypothetical protein n=1 Tax=Paenibacillus sp. GCM10027628 TaxID=3273413 RepID=UPI00362B9BB3